MARRRKEPHWLSRLVVDAIHSDQLREHGGLRGVRDENALESALARPQQRWHYAEDSDIASIAAVYAFGLVKNHPYGDGNKRIGFLALVTFLDINGFDFEAPEADIVVTILRLAAGTMSEEELVQWVRANLRRRSK